MEEKKYLVELVGETIVQTAIAYPLVSGLITLVSDQHYVETLNDSSTVLFVGGIGFSSFLYKCSHEFYKRYQLKKEENSL